MGTPQEMTDHTGVVIWKAQYKAWGECKVEQAKSDFFENSEIISNNIRFQGQYFDGETGLHYNRYRYYSPYVRRFISKDPIGLLGGDNVYAYAPNPVSWIDPLGLSGFDPFTHGEITSFPENIHFGQKRVAPQFSNIGSQASDLIRGRDISEVAKDLKSGKVSANEFVISYTIDPKTGVPITLNNRGLAALSEANIKPDSAILVPYDKAPKHLLKDGTSKTIDVTKNKDGSGKLRTVLCPF
ncbi:RHS domain-containing protein [Acinetobacter baumannii]